MKALSLLQPWASLVAARIKWLETRSWQTEYRGPLAIHASAQYSRQARALAATPPFRWALRRCPQTLPVGAVICTAELVGIYPVEAMIGEPGQFEFPFDTALDLAGQFPFGNFSAGRFIWHLANIQRLPVPEPAKGALRLWDFDLAA